MRILIISDIHANWPALEAVAREPHDAVICLGDIVGYGPNARACTDWVREHATWVVQGNHDLANADDVSPRCQPNFAWLADAVVPLTNAQLDAADRAFLRGLPRWAVRDVEGLRVACFHAKPSDPLYGYMPSDAAVWGRELDKVEADLVLVGHTHQPIDLVVRGQRLVNPGSVGQPKHGDARAAYAVLVDGQAALKRVAYPVEQTITDLAQSSVDGRAVAVLSEMLRTGEAPQVHAERVGSQP
jgi:putative phosphoesterase